MSDNDLRNNGQQIISAKCLTDMTLDDAVAWLSELRDAVTELAERLPTREERLAEAEQRAWDVYFAQMNRCMSRDMALAEVNRMLEERRKRFGAGKEPPKPCLLAVTEDLLARTIEALVGDSGAEERAVLAQQLRALVSE